MDKHITIEIPTDLTILSDVSLNDVVMNNIALDTLEHNPYLHIDGNLVTINKTGTPGFNISYINIEVEVYIVRQPNGKLNYFMTHLSEIK